MDENPALQQVIESLVMLRALCHQEKEAGVKCHRFDRASRWKDLDTHFRRCQEICDIIKGLPDDE